MFKYLYYRTRYGSYLRNEDGIKKFAEMTLSQLSRRVTKKSAFFREMDENLLVEKANLRMRADELVEKPMLDAGEFFGVRRRLLGNTVIIAAVIVAAVFLNYLSVAAFITEEAAISNVIRWFASAVLAIVLTGGGLIVAERLIESLLPRRTPRTEQLRDLNQSVAPLWALLLIGIELALLGLAEVRASTLGATQTSSTLYYGYIVMTMLLPIIAGAIRWDAMQYLDVYKATQALRQIESRLAQIDSILRQNEEFESNFYKLRSVLNWDMLNEFKTFKDNYNRKKGYTEDLTGHFAQSYDAFQAEANKRYQSDIRDITSKSLRKLEMPDGRHREQLVGAKVGQALRPALAEREAPAAAPSAATAEVKPASDIYLSPQPIR